MTKPNPSSRIRFGVFELDVQSGELRKGTVRVRLQNQPLRVLVALLNKPGEVVSREELRQELWPADTFGDFEHGLRVAVAKLRQALNDDPNKPRYVETLPTRGYRFIFPITPPILEPAGTDADTSGAKDEPVRKRSRFGRIAIVTGCVALLAAAGFLWFMLRGKRHLTEKDSIVLADFTNTTGDAVFDNTLRQGLSAQLEQSPFLNTITDAKIQDTLQMMGQKPDANLTPEIAREVCQRTSSTTVLQGSIAKIGTEYLLTLKAVNCWSGDLLGNSEVRASDKDHVLTSLSSAASEIRRKLGESSASISKYDIPLEQVTTTSLEALKLFSLYARAHGRIPPEPILQRAVELDPNFAAAYELLSDAASDSGEAERASEYAQKAFDLRNRVSERERLTISATYYSATLGDSEQELRSWQLLQQLYPRDWGPWNNSASTRLSLGDYAQALKDAEEALHIDPDNSSPYINVGMALLSLGRGEEARSVAKQALARGMDYPDMHILIYRTALLAGNTKEMESELTPLLSQEGGGEWDPLWEQSRTEAYFGRFKSSLAFSQRALETLKGGNFNELRAMALAAEALREAEIGNTDQAKRFADKARALSSGRNAKIFSALALARAGEPARATVLANELDAQLPSNTLVQRYWLPTIRGAIELARNNPSRALDILKGASYELGYNQALSDNLYSVYIRGQAYLATRQGREAGLEFQRVLDHRAILLNSPLDALSELGLARAYSLQGETAAAQAEYQKFFALWKDADSDIPILKYAKAEYAKLH
jgi:DNA-binding winged helix-turn-helix (wHTH) protein/tetratricopeptide (TPR) repeat protein